MTSKLNLYVLLALSAALASTISAPANADPQRAQAQANFFEADADQDEQLDMAEFTAFINLNADHNLGRAAMVRRFGMYGRAFGTADANADGVVSKDEIAARAQQ
jgi:Ca2+-binding EF-hand superfamily protein